MPLYLQNEIQELDLGDHVCFVYSNLAEQLSALVTWILQGLKRSEQCFCVQHPHTGTALLKMLKTVGVDVRHEIDRGALVLCDMGETYLPSGEFDPNEMAGMLADSVSKARTAGFTGFRVTGDMSWALENKPGSHLLLPYEQAMEGFFSQHAALGMCQYHAKQFPAATLHKTMLVHGTTFLQDEGVPNHYQIRLRRQHLFADILKSTGPGAYYHYVVQQDGSPEIISWGQTLDLGTAKREASAVLHQYAA